MTFEQWIATYPDAAAALRSVTTPGDVPAGASSEARTQQELRLAADARGYALWRNNNGACLDDTGRMIRFGLGNDSKKINDVWKSSDLIGIGPGGRFVACEVKHPGWTKPESDRDRAQANFLGHVNSLGGIGFFATHRSHFDAAIAGALPPRGAA